MFRVSAEPVTTRQIVVNARIAAVCAIDGSSPAITGVLTTKTMTILSTMATPTESAWTVNPPYSGHAPSSGPASAHPI